MKPVRPVKTDERSATLAQTLWLMTACSGLLMMTAYASQPGWWNSRGAVNASSPTNNYAAVTQGQVKLFTQKAVDEMNANLPGGAGSTLSNMVYNWKQDYLTNGYATNTANPARPYKASDLQVMNVGQLKYIAGLVYGRLASAGYTGLTPSWLHQNTGSDNMAADIGQLKQVFNFNVTATPVAVTGLTATGNIGEIDLSWSDPAYNPVTSITVQQSTDGGTTWTTVATLAANATSYAATGLSPAQSYTYKVSANNSTTSASTSSSTVTSQPTSPNAPNIPTGLTGAGDNSGDMNLSWTASTGATSYKVERETLATGTWSTLGTTSGTTYQDTGYGAMGGYHYRVSAVSASGTSGPSGEWPQSRYAIIDLGTNLIFPQKITTSGYVLGSGITGATYSYYAWHNGANTALQQASSSDIIQATDIDNNGRVVGLEMATNYYVYNGNPTELATWTPGGTTPSLTSAPSIPYTTGGNPFPSSVQIYSDALASPHHVWSGQVVFYTAYPAAVWVPIYLHDGFEDAVELGSFISEVGFPDSYGQFYTTGAYFGTPVRVLACNDNDQALLENNSNFQDWTYNGGHADGLSTSPHSTTYTVAGNPVPSSLMPLVYVQGGRYFDYNYISRVPSTLQGTLSNTNSLGKRYLLGSDQTVSWTVEDYNQHEGNQPVFSTPANYYCWDGTATYTLPQPSGALVIPAGVNAATTTLTTGSTTTTVAATQVIGNYNGNGYLWEMAPTTSSTKTFNAPLNINDLLAPKSGFANFWASSINDGGCIAATAIKDENGDGIFNIGTYDYNTGTWSGPDHYHGVMLIPCEISVDANRDGKVVLANDANNPANVDSHGNPLPVDSTSSAKPYRFWLNNNEDQSSYDIRFGTSPKTVPPDPSHEDYLSSTIVSKLDLEDWTRLWIYTKGLNTAIQSGAIKVGLKWNSTSGTTPGIKIIKATDSDGGIEYLSDTTGAAATAQATTGGSPRPVLQDANDSHTNIVPTGGAADFVFPTSVWSSLSDTAPKTFFLFEGTSEGKGQLQIVFLKSDGTTLLGSGGNLWLDLKDVKEMYQRAIAAGAGPIATPPTEPYVYGSPGFADSIGTSIDAGNPFVAPLDETSQCIVFVHGWYTDWNGFTEYSGDFYKRLWWQGYKGRFVGFTWPALSGAATYNSSEWNAWLYGKAFKNYINSVKGSYTKFTVAGHSQGNVVIGSAIQEGLTIPNYILLQAAEPTGLYTTNNTYNNYAPFVNQEVTYPTPDTAANLGYRGFILPSMGNASHYYCFFNPDDYALATGTSFGFASNWEANQLGYKPDGDPGSAGLGHYASFGTTLVSGASGDWDPDNIFHPVVNVTESHESMSFIARARSQAAGADPNSPAVFGAANATDLKATYGFGRAETDHSGQFLRDYNQVYPLYHQFETIIAPTP